MFRTGGVVQAGAPDVLGEVEAEEAEEEARDFEPEDTADTAERPQEASESATGTSSGCTCVFVAFGGQVAGAVEDFFAAGQRLGRRSVDRSGAGRGSGRGLIG